MDSADLNKMTPEEILELQKKNCIFCKIIAKEIPSSEIYSDDKVTVILDINPANEGHCLILPKKHYQILPQLPDELIGYMFKTAKNTSRALLKSLGIKGTTTFVANGALAGQKAPHFMIHVVPRKPGDLLFTVPKHAIEDERIKEMREKLYHQLNGRPLHKEKEQKNDELPVQSEAIQKMEEEKPHEDPMELLGGADRSKEDRNKKDEEDADEAKTQKEEPKAKRSSDVNIDDIANMFL